MAVTSAVNIIMLFSWKKPLSDLLWSWDVIFAITPLWIRQARDATFSVIPQNHTVLPSASKALEPISYSFGGCDGMLLPVGGHFMDLCSVAVDHIRVRLEQRPLDVSDLTADVNVLHWLCQVPHRIPILPEFRVMNVITHALNAAASQPLSRRIEDVNSAQTCIVKCSNALTHLIEGGCGTQPIQEALKAGCLLAIITSNKWYLHGSPPDSHCDSRVFLLAEILPRYLIYRPLLMEIMRSVRNIEASGLERLLRPEDPLRAAWFSLKALAARRSATKEKYDGDGGLEYRCRNERCQARGPKALFLKCSGCLDAPYCDKECQKRDWKEGNHRTICKELQELTTNGHSIKIPGRTGKFILDVFLDHLHSQRAEILRLKATRFPETPFSSLVLDCCFFTNPEVIRMSLVSQFPMSGPSWDRMVGLTSKRENTMVGRVTFSHGHARIALHRVLSTIFLTNSSENIDVDGHYNHASTPSEGEDDVVDGYYYAIKVFGEARHCKPVPLDDGDTSFQENHQCMESLTRFSEPQRSLCGDQFRCRVRHPYDEPSN
ncbi:hypothetical protein JAAARDRAFT_188533 [Jaapia argillacea MUCL 33604]|uniref:MYND-type domain-containing protein n=1 Tax=Jaapia argillacea MUCL 33604 TaxID=933084 RepID=A0A067Q9R3_9AGAM|nr:hypothetical protein JAAARDRAFT_188533 [Jaapia argillacea MUCL 33604]